MYFVLFYCIIIFKVVSMQKLIQLDYYPDVLVSSTIKNCDKIDFIYLPIDDESTILVRKNETVFVGTAILENKNDICVSPISGVVSDIKEVYTLSGRKKAIEIANDFKDKTLVSSRGKRSISKMDKAFLDASLMSHFQLNLNQKKCFVLNCIDDEPCVVTENFYLFLNSDSFLEMLDKLYKIYHLEKLIIVVKSVSSENISKLMNHLGMYPNITLRIVPNLYLLGYPPFLLSYLKLEEKQSIAEPASKFYSIYELLRCNRVLTSKLITITGNGIKKPMVVKVRIGSKIKDFIYDMDLDSDIVLIANGLMHGTIISDDNFVVEPSLSSIFVMKKSETIQEEKCIHCGACIDICPVGLNPTLLKKEKYRKLVEGVCLDCGLCSYICPAHINFKRKEEKNYE